MPCFAVLISHTAHQLEVGKLDREPDLCFDDPFGMSAYTCVVLPHPAGIIGNPPKAGDAVRFTTAKLTSRSS